MLYVANSIAAGPAPTVTQGGTPGAVTYGYEIAWLTAVGNGALGPEQTTATGAAVLSGGNYNIVDPGPCPPNVMGYIVMRSTDPNGNTGVLPVTGSCGSPVNDTYPAQVNYNNVNDQSAGFYGSHIKADLGDFGASPYLESTLVTYSTIPGVLNAVSYQALNAIAINAVAESPGYYGIGIDAVGSSTDAGTARGGTFAALHTGNANASMGLLGVTAYIGADLAGDIPGWSAAFSGSESTYSTGAFQNIAFYDCAAGSLSNPGTGDNVCLHSAQAPIPGSSVYFVLEEGGLPSKLTGPLILKPIAADPGCTTAADYGKFWFDNTGASTVRKTCNKVAGTPAWVVF